MRVLVYAFKPYGPYETNITEQVLSHPQFCPRVSKKVFDVEFDYDMFNRTFMASDAQIILGMGQHPRARKLRNERKARNLYKTLEGEFQPINEAGPLARFSTLDLPAGGDLTTTYNAGNYVCNFSMYIAAEYCDKSGARFGFIHVPRKYPARSLIKFLNTILDRAMIGA